MNKRTTIELNNVSIVILAGGQAKRMQNQDKGRVLLDGRPLIEHVLERIKPQNNNIFISANRNLSEYSKLGYPVIPDQFSHFPGPLAGIEAALKVIDTEWLLTVPCDAPRLDTDYVKKMTQHNGLARAYVAKHKNYIQPGFCLWHESTRTMIRASLQAQERAVHKLLSKMNAINIEFDDDSQCFVNINTLDELNNYEQQH